MRTGSLVAAVLVLLVSMSRAATPPVWSEALIKLERWPAGADSAQVSTAFSVAPGMLATILIKPENSDNYRAVTSGSTRAVKLLARDSDSGFALLAALSSDEKSWPVVPLEATQPPLLPGASLTLQSSTPAPARLAGRDMLHQSRLLESPWLRVHLPQGVWTHGTPLTNPDGSLAGMLAGDVADVTEAGRVLPAAAVVHFVKLWNEQKTLSRARLGLKLSPAAGIPRVEECVAALPAERAGLQPGDVLLRIGAQVVNDATAAAEACFYLRVDEPVKVVILRGTQVMELTMTPASSTAPKQPGRK